MVEFLNRIFYFLYYFLFFHFILLHTRVLYPPSFISFSPLKPYSNIICSSHLRKERDRETEREEKDWEIGVHHAVRDRGSPCCQRSRSNMHYHVRRPTVARPPPHHQARSDQLVLFFSLFFFIFFYFLFFIFACSDSTLFYKNWNLFCVLCLDYVRNGVTSVCSFFFFFFFHMCLF